VASSDPTPDARRWEEAIETFGSTLHIERVRGKLLQLARNYGRVALDGMRIDFPLSHTLLADMVGSSRETVTRY
jgi:CRP-like cAMP-binding protein